jgi:hypothetical protein
MITLVLLHLQPVVFKSENIFGQSVHRRTVKKQLFKPRMLMSVFKQQMEGMGLSNTNIYAVGAGFMLGAGCAAIARRCYPRVCRALSEPRCHVKSSSQTATRPSNGAMDPSVLVDKLNLIPHPEGGFFREVYRSGSTPMASKGATDETGTVMTTGRDPPPRNVMTSIYWLLNQDSPNGWWCR